MAHNTSTVDAALRIYREMRRDRCADHVAKHFLWKLAFRRARVETGAAA